ncbi:high-affinity branched-chain amino acid ABC transporter permease LivM [Ferrovibrio sp.]|uniref:high-affinity branched-chain amino acid ABC transporter permease LivM n=1 Tax=Ferrovibrio sp. TaxID=1917215 RepID=UPI000CB62C4A|nr:high-affinity branched-chain amino acid ABC transporter permease LivM [Ferrovibrio sp.]PJI44273.1 MAG: branched-chain amino acid ABC transporter permease [Ferrovibrio sp.]
MTVAERLKDAIMAAAVAALLALPLIGFETVDTGGPLGIKTRFDYIAYAAIVVFLGRLGMRIAFDWRRSYRERIVQAEPTNIDRKELLTVLGQKADKWLMPVMIGFAIVMPFLPFANRTVIDLGTVVLIYVMLGWGLNIVVGLAGLLDLGYVAFYAVGAYTFATLSMHFGFGFWETLPLAGLLAATFGVVLGFPVLRLRGDYLAIVTLGFGEIIRVILLNWQPVTGGPAGISGIPRPSFFGFPFSADPPEGATAFHQLFGLEYASIHRIIFLYYLILALALVTNLFTMRIRKLPVGRAWEALREDEIACTALGINPTNTKLTAFAIGAMFGGFAGSFFATRQGFISPESFSFIESAVILAIVVLGGMGSQAGIVLAAAFLTLLPEVAREFSLFRMLAFGAAMVLIMVWRPQGLLAHREPTMRLHPAGTKPGGGKP